VSKIKRIALIIISITVAAAAAITVLYFQTAYTVPVLMYHSIDHNDKVTKLSVSPESFDRQMQFLRENNYNIITLEEAVSYIKREMRAPLRTVAITFDDGFQNNYLYAYPVLKKYNIPAAIFVIVNRIGSPGFLNWEEIKEMSDSGLVTIGSHTRTHFWLLGSDPRFLEDEVVNSKKILENKLGKKVNLFCYPMGAFDDKSKKAVEDAGYECAVSTKAKNAPTDIYAIKRIKISRSSDNLFIFWAETTKLYAWFKCSRSSE
jgi:peptidoglycan/xylan/chitin deacetylase (PgdA/CDA1 family)